MNKIVSTAMVTLALGYMTVSAQVSQGVVAKVPFNFVAGQKSFASGDYRVKLYSSMGVVSIQSLDGKTHGSALCGSAESAKAHTHASLIFNRYSNEYFLNQLWMQGEKTGLELVKTRRELEVASTMTRTLTTVTASDKQ
jgi:hypothetical protein